MSEGKGREESSSVGRNDRNIIDRKSNVFGSSLGFRRQHKHMEWKTRAGLILFSLCDISVGCDSTSTPPAPHTGSSRWIRDPSPTCYLLIRTLATLASLSICTSVNTSASIVVPVPGRKRLLIQETRCWLMQAGSISFEALRPF